MNFRVLTDELLLADNYDGSVTVKDLQAKLEVERRATGNLSHFMMSRSRCLVKMAGQQVA